MQHIFMNNFQLCSEINERVVQHFVHCIETHGRSVHYLKFLQTIVKAENKFIKKCQDIVMAEVCGPHTGFNQHRCKGVVLIDFSMTVVLSVKCLCICAAGDGR